MSLSSDTENEEDEVTVVRVKRKSQNVYEEIDLTEESDLASANDDPGYNPITNANASNIPHYVPESETQKSSLPNGNQENNETVINETIREMINSFNPLNPPRLNGLSAISPTPYGIGTWTTHKLKEWHKSITIELRTHLVNKL